MMRERETSESIGAVQAELLELERAFWEASSSGDGEFYRTRAAPDALYVFPGPTGVLTNEECAGVVDGNDTPWEWFRIADPRFLRIADAAWVLTYTSRAQHQGGRPFSMRVSTLYRRDEGEWKLAFHQQTMAPNG